MPGPLTIGLKYFYFRGVIQILGLKKLSHTGRLTRWGMTTGESCFGRFYIDSSGYDTPGRLTCGGIIPAPGRLTRWGIIPG